MRFHMASYGQGWLLAEFQRQQSVYTIWIDGFRYSCVEQKRGRRQDIDAIQDALSWSHNTPLTPYNSVIHSAPYSLLADLCHFNKAFHANSPIQPPAHHRPAYGQMPNLFSAINPSACSESNMMKTQPLKDSVISQLTKWRCKTLKVFFT